MSPYSRSTAEWKRLAKQSQRDAIRRRRRQTRSGVAAFLGILVFLVVCWTAIGLFVDLIVHLVEGRL